MVKKIAIFGAGSTGHGAAALYAQKGFAVTLCDDERFVQRLAQVTELGGIQLRGKLRGIGTGIAVTTNPAEAIKDAQFIMIHVMSSRHEEVARLIASHVVDGQHILIVPGNLGSFVFRKVFEQAGVTADVTLSEMEGNLFPCRLSGAAEVTVGLPLRGKRIASLPAKDTTKVMEALKGILEIAPNRNVLEGAINANNVVLHIATTVLSATRIENIGNRFGLFHEGFTPASVRCVEAIHQERLAILDAMGITEHANPLGTIGKIQNPQAHPEMEVFLNLGGPDSVQHRYIDEDASCGGAFALSVARRCGIATPVLAAFLVVAGTMNGQDYIGQGRTLENLGFGPELSLGDIDSLLS